MSTPRTLLIDDQGRVMRRQDGDLATPDCPECCNPGSCARATLCTETPDYENVHPKMIVFDCPEDRRLCTSPPGPWLVQYNGYCYEPNYDEDGLLVCGFPCITTDADHVYVGDPAESLTCLAEKSCMDSPCNDGYHDPECCKTDEQICPPGCPCGAVTCDCGRRFICIWHGYRRERNYNVTFVDGYGDLCDDIVTEGSGAFVMNYYDDGFGGCLAEPRVFGGSTQTWDHRATCYGSDFTTVDFTDGGWADCGEWWEHAFRFVKTHNDLPWCGSSGNVSCGPSQTGRVWNYTGSVIDCQSVTFSGTYVERREGTCVIAHQWEYEYTAFYQRLYECDESRPGDPPSIGELGLF